MAGRVRDRREPDRVPVWPGRVRDSVVPDRVSSRLCLIRRPHVSAVVTVGHAARPSSAMPRPNSRLEPTPPAAVNEHVFFSMAVAFYRGAFGGAAKADRWAALSPTHRAEPSGQPERPRITTHQWV